MRAPAPPAVPPRTEVLPVRLQAAAAIRRLGGLRLGGLELAAQVCGLLLSLLELHLEIVVGSILAGANRSLDHLLFGHGASLRGLSRLIGLHVGLGGLACLVGRLYGNLHVPLLGVSGGGGSGRLRASNISGHDYLSSSTTS